jgi:hypothetical protein
VVRESRQWEQWEQMGGERGAQERFELAECGQQDVFWRQAYG